MKMLLKRVLGLRRWFPLFVSVCWLLMVAFLSGVRGKSALGTVGTLLAASVVLGVWLAAWYLPNLKRWLRD